MLEVFTRKFVRHVSAAVLRRPWLAGPVRRWLRNTKFGKKLARRIDFAVATDAAFPALNADPHRAIPSFAGPPLQHRIATEELLARIGREVASMHARRTD